MLLWYNTKASNLANAHFSEKQMNQTEQILLQAIQKSLWNTDITFPEDTDWNAVLKESEDQAILGIVIGVAPTEAQKEWKARASAGTAHYVRILHYQQLISKLMTEHGIPLAILKGSAASVYYPTPSKRAMGDIDCIVPKNRYEEANKVLLNNGFTFVSEHFEKRHKSYVKDGVSFELHYHFSYTDIDVESFVEEGLKHLEIETVDGVSFPMLPKLANGLVLLAHMLHHFKTAVGLRQVIDWMMYVNAVLDDTFWETEFKTAADQVGLTTAACVATRMCQMHLGLSDRITWCKAADQGLCRELMEKLLTSGNFGRKQGIGMAIESVSSHFRAEGVFHYLQKNGEINWKAYHKHKWLKPLAWIYQACRYVRKGILAKRKGIQISAGIARGQQRNELYQKLKIGQ